MKKVVMIGLVVCCSACGMTGGYDVALFGTKDGMEAYSDHLSNLVTNAKATADTRSAAYELRMQQEAEKTNRLAGRKSLFGSLFNKKAGDK